MRSISLILTPAKYQILTERGEQILSLQFKDNDTLQLKLASGELLDWSITTNSPKRLLILPKRLQLLMLTQSVMPMF